MQLVMVVIMRYLPLLLMMVVASGEVMAAKGGKGGGGDGDSTTTKGKDRAAPTITVPENISVAATSASGAAVSYVVQVSDNKDASPSWSCSPASGAVFAVGQNTVSCQASDDSGNRSVASFLVTVTATVTDTEAPVLSLPSTISAETDAADGMAVEYQVSAQDNMDSSVSVSCLPASGAMFSVGETQVQCSATDEAGNNAKGSFQVVVTSTVPEPAPEPDPQPEPESDPIPVPLPDISISWAAPTTRQDGSALSTGELGGYDIFVIAEQSGNDEVINVSDPNVTSYTYKPQVADTYFFSITSYDASGMSSDMSETVSIVVE